MLCQIELSVGQRGDGRRVDAYLPARMNCFSRNQIQGLMADGHVLVNGKPVKPSHRLRSGMKIQFSYPADTLKPLIVSDDVDLQVLWEDDALLAINKPAGMPTQPRHRFEGGALVNALIGYLGMTGLNGPGIVHRLDRNTSGVVLVGKTLQARAALGRQFEQHTVAKEYLAIVAGVPREDRVTLAIGQDQQVRERMAVDVPQAQPAETCLRVVERLAGDRHSLVACFPRTGRTHQIRVHLAAIGHPILADDFYGVQPPAGLPLKRHALHALRVCIDHPLTSEPFTVEAPLPDDMEQTLSGLREREED